MSKHEKSVGATDEWYTPSYIFEAMGCVFDLDVAHPGKPKASWVPALNFYTKNSLSLSWYGFVWMNPPFGGRNGIVPWLEKFFSHGNGVALTPDRTSAPWWSDYARRCDAVLFVSPKIKFIGADGFAGKSPAQGTSLMASGQMGVNALKQASKSGIGVLFCSPQQK